MPEIDTLIFDIDDTLYPLSSGFSNHRNGEVVTSFMVEKLGFESEGEAKALRDEYFRRYHSTMKGFSVAGAEGMLPKPFKQEELAEYFAERCDFARYCKPDPAIVEALQSLSEVGLAFVAFTNAPRRYGLRCLDFLGVRSLFPNTHVFGVEDVLPACKPEPEAFRKVLEAVGTCAERCVMFEDSMKNIRASKALGIHTVLVDEGTGGGEAALLQDTPDRHDPAVDAVLQSIGELRTKLPSLWERRFEPSCSATAAAVVD